MYFSFGEYLLNFLELLTVRVELLTILVIKEVKMIVDSILLILKNIISFLLLPLTPINFAINTILGISYVSDFIKIATYVLPWSNLTPIITIIIGMFLFRIIISLVKTVWDLIPFL